MNSLRLLCTDLDRTLIPNGEPVEWPGVRQRFAALIAQHAIHLAYVSGRDQHLVQQAINEYRLPDPEYVIADVGSTIYVCEGKDWSLLEAWYQHIGHDWAERTAMQIHQFFADMPSLVLQEANRQGRYKLSFYVSLQIDHTTLIRQMQQRAASAQIAISVIYSVDEEKHIGLLDVLPASANKLAAVRYLMHELGLHENEVLFAGDSGNDLDVLCSELPAVLVANAQDCVRQQAIEMAGQAGYRGQLYLAQGVTGNGYYADGILEGMYYFFPHLQGRSG